MPEQNGTRKGEESPGPFTASGAGCAAFAGKAAVVALLHPRTISEGPVLVLDNAEFDVVRVSTEIPRGAVGVMAFDVGPVILVQPVWVKLTSRSGLEVISADPSTYTLDARLGYAIKSPILYERFVVVGKTFPFVVRAGQPGWKLVQGSVRDDAMASHLNLFSA